MLLVLLHLVVVVVLGVEESVVEAVDVVILQVVGLVVVVDIQLVGDKCGVKAFCIFLIYVTLIF